MFLDIETCHSPVDASFKFNLKWNYILSFILTGWNVQNATVPMSLHCHGEANDVNVVANVNTSPSFFFFFAIFYSSYIGHWADWHALVVFYSRCDISIVRLTWCCSCGCHAFRWLLLADWQCCLACFNYSCCALTNPPLKCLKSQSH